VGSIGVGKIVFGLEFYEGLCLQFEVSEYFTLYGGSWLLDIGCKAAIRREKEESDYTD